MTEGKSPTTGRVCPNMVGFTCYNPACRDACARDPRLVSETATGTTVCKKSWAGIGEQ